MKKTLLLFLFLFSFNYSFAQHATNVKKTALAMLRAGEQKDYDVYISYFYPTELKYRGGKAKWIQQLKSNDKLAKLLNFTSGMGTLGTVSKIYQAGKELHCTIEWDHIGKEVISKGHFLAISIDQGKTWKFIMTSGKTPSEVWAMVPKFNENLTWVDYDERP